MSAPFDLTLATPKRLTNPTPAQVDEMVEVLMQAFKDDPLLPIFVGTDLDLAILLNKGTIGSAVVGGLLHVLTIPASPKSEEGGDGGERIIGVAMWYPPGLNPNATPEQRAAGWDEFTATAKERNPELHAWWTDYYRPHVQAAHASILPSTNFATDSWTLLTFAVLPEFQGKGLGKRLYTFAEVQAEEAKVPVLLRTVTELDVLIYKRFGLEVVGEFMIESERGDVKMWVMVKKWE